MTFQMLLSDIPYTIVMRRESFLGKSMVLKIIDSPAIMCSRFGDHHSGNMSKFGPAYQPTSHTFVDGS